MTDRQHLLTMRIVLVTFTACALLFALNGKSTIYDLVSSAYQVTLVGAFVPLVTALYWKRATTQGALAAIAFGVGPGCCATTSHPRRRFRRSWRASVAVGDRDGARLAGAADARQPRRADRARAARSAGALTQDPAPIIEGFVFGSPAMPIYAYKCASCGHAKDVLQKMSDPLLAVCPACGAPRVQQAAHRRRLPAQGLRLVRHRFPRQPATKPADDGKAAGADYGDDAGDKPPAQRRRPAPSRRRQAD